MNKKFFTGASVRQALLQAARHFQVEPEQVAYREVDRRHGFLRGRRRAVIEVDLDNPVRATAAPEEEATVAVEEETATGAAEVGERDPARPERTPVGDGEPAAEEVAEDVPIEDLPTDELPIDRLREATGAADEPFATPPRDEGAQAPGEQPGDVREAPFPPESAADTTAERALPPDPELVGAAHQALGRIFELGKLDLKIEEIKQGEEKLEIELRGTDEEYLLEDRGRLLLAIQHLLPRMLRGLTGRSTPCQVDCDDFHEIRTEQLRDLAQRVATEVRNQRRSRTLEPMSPDERRIVHLTLADDPAVETVSQGNGLFKRVQIRPQKIQPRGFDPFGREPEPRRDE